MVGLVQWGYFETNQGLPNPLSFECLPISPSSILLDRTKYFKAINFVSPSGISPCNESDDKSMRVFAYKIQAHETESPFNVNFTFWFYNKKQLIEWVGCHWRWFALGSHPSYQKSRGWNLWSSCVISPIVAYPSSFQTMKVGCVKTAQHAALRDGFHPLGGRKSSSKLFLAEIQKSEAGVDATKIGRKTSSYLVASNTEIVQTWPLGEVQVQRSMNLAGIYPGSFQVWTLAELESSYIAIKHIVWQVQAHFPTSNGSSTARLFEKTSSSHGIHFHRSQAKGRKEMSNFQVKFSLCGLSGTTYRQLILTVSTEDFFGFMVPAGEKGNGTRSAELTIRSNSFPKSFPLPPQSIPRLLSTWSHIHNKLVGFVHSLASTMFL